MNSKELLQKVDKLESRGMAITRQWHDLWSEGMRYFFSDHDRGCRRHDDWDFIIVNYVWPTAMQEIAKLAKNNPKIYAQPRSDDDSDSAEVWQGATQWQWEVGLKMRLNQIAAILCGKIFGYRVSKVFWETKCTWNNDLKRWEGDVKFKNWHPAQFWADGQENINDGNCGTVRYVTLAYAQKIWPKFKKELADLAISSKDNGMESLGGLSFKASTNSSGTYTEIDDSEVGNTSPTTILNLIDSVNEIPQDSDEKYVRIAETYLKDDEEKHVKIEADIPSSDLIASGVAMADQMGQIYDMQGQLIAPDNWPKVTTAEYDEPVFPFGRIILTAGEGDKRILLNPNLDEQKWFFRSWPFITTPHYLLPFMWQGVNAVSLYKSTQDMINISVSHMINNLKQFGDPRVAVEDGAMALNPKNKKPWSIKSGAGALIRLVKGGIGRYRVEPPMPLSPAAVGLYELFSQEYKNITGLQGVAQGMQMKSGTTATEAQTLAISANDRIFLQSVYEDEWVRDVATLIADMMQIYYDEGRWIRILGEDKLVGIKQITSKEKDARYDLYVEPGTTLPYDEEKRILRFKEAYQLIANPVANPMLPEMLKVLNIPNWRKMLDELPTYKQYLEFSQLVDGVRSGKVDPNQAMQVVMQKLQEIYGANLVPQQGGEA